MKRVTKRTNKRFDHRVLRGYTAAVILFAVLAWPSEGRSRTSIHACEVNDVHRLLDNWASALKQSWQPHGNPRLIVDKYATGAVLLPTCANGPAIGHAEIEDYFDHFLQNKPVVETFGHPAIGGDCNVAFASGLYIFKLNGGTNKEVRLPARYTYIFRRGLIMQHHSSLEPATPSAVCPH